MFPNVQHSNLQVDAGSETKCAYTQTQLNLLVQTEIQHLLQFTLHRMMNDRCNYGKSVG